MARTRARPGPWAWIALPAELRLMILSAIAQQKLPGWASLASVCREWQSVLEKANLYKLKLEACCLDDFEQILSPQKRDMIRHVYFTVELPRYTYSCCYKRKCYKRRSQPPKIDSVVSDGIWRLFSILSRWRPRPGHQLTLEINIYSPSDCEHWFKDLELSSDDIEPDEYAAVPHHDPQHGWENGQQVKAPPIYAIQRIFRPIELKFRDTLPRVNAITCLIIRRQLRRCISPRGLGLLMDSLDRLEQLSYEPWAPYRHPTREFYDRGLSFLMRDHLPETLSRLTIFEESYAFYDTFPRMHTWMWFGLADPTGGPGATLASKSLGLEHLAVSFLVGAEEIFRHCQSTWSWSRLQTLALTSHLLRKPGDEGEYRQIEALLCRAGVLAKNMPELHTLILWNGGKAHACAFIYRGEGEKASITWRGTWHLDLSAPVVESWQLVASKLSYELQIQHEYVEGIVSSPGDALYHLELPCQVIDPRSLWQIRRETPSLRAQ